MPDTAPILGIDFGTCQCSVAWFNPRSGQAELLRNAEGYEKTPSVVFYDKDQGEVLVGSAAEFMLDDEQTSRDVKVGIKHDIGKDVLIHLGGKDRRPTEIAADILRKLKRDAEQLHFKMPVTAAVVAHPAAFDATERERLAEAATLAGFERVLLLSEPEAAAIAVTKAGVKVGNNLVVYDLGAGTFDLTVLLQTGDGNYRLPIGSRGQRCGGDDFDRALYDYCDGVARQQHGRGVAEDGQVDPQFLRTCRQRKENLSLSSRHWVDFSSVLRGEPPIVFKHRVERAKFEELIRPLIEATVRATVDLVEDAERTGYKPDSILLIGGSSRIPLVVTQLKAALPIEPVQWQQQDVAVALGAAIFGDTKLAMEGGRGAPVSPEPKAAVEPPLVTELDLQFHRAVIDAQAKQIAVHAEAMIGLSDGSSQPGVSVSFFVNGKPCIEVPSDEFGRAVLQTGLPPELFVAGVNNIAARVKGSGKTAKASFPLLKSSSVSRLGYRREKWRTGSDYNDRRDVDYEESIELEVRLAANDFTAVSGIQCGVLLKGDDTDSISRSLVTDAEGLGRVRVTRNYESEEVWICTSWLGRGEKGAELNKIREAYVTLIGFPESFCLHKHREKKKVHD
jgi:actin-like ATPase involved in cell morphogenesis